MKLVKQEDACGCAVACIAMVTGRTYQSVRADWLNDFSREGVTSVEVIGYLGDVGYSVVYKRISNWIHKDFAKKEMLRPFAPVHIVGLKPRFDSKNGHWVVMDSKGKIYCPGETPEDEIRKSFVFDEVIGLYK